MGFDGVKGVFDDEILRDYGGELNLFGESSYQKYVIYLISNPKKIISSTNPKSSVGNALKALLVLGVAFGILFTVYNTITSFVGGYFNITLLAFNLIFLVFAPLLMIIGSFMISVVEFVFLKIFGGKGKFETLFYLISVVYLPIYYLIYLLQDVIIIFLSYVIPPPIFFYAALIVQFLPMIYMFYILTLILKEVGQFSTLKAVLCWLIPTGVIVGLSLFVLYSVSQMGGFNPFAAPEYHGFTEIPLTGPGYLAGSNDPNTGYVTLIMYSLGESTFLDSKELKISKNGLDCEISDVSFTGIKYEYLQSSGGGEILSSIEKYIFLQNLTDNPEIEIPKNMPFNIKAKVEGAGCGGLKGTDYTYVITMPYTRLGQPFDNSGSISGKYVEETVEFSWEIGYSTSGPILKYNIYGM